MRADETDELILRALEEDMPFGDITSESLIPPRALARALLMAKQPGVLAGLEAAIRVFRALDPRVSVNRFLCDGAAFKAGDILAEIEGRAVTILAAERTALNLLQRLCGIATMARRYVDAVAGTGVRSSTPARRPRACAPSKNTRSGWAGRRITGRICRRWSSSRTTTS